jgi:hypothetical protein
MFDKRDTAPQILARKGRPRASGGEPPGSLILSGPRDRLDGPVERQRECHPSNGQAKSHMDGSDLPPLIRASSSGPFRIGTARPPLLY